MANLVKAIRENDGFADGVRQELNRIRQMERVQPDRYKACWISRLTKETLTAALAAID